MEAAPIDTESAADTDVLEAREPQVVSWLRLKRTKNFPINPEEPIPDYLRPLNTPEEWADAKVKVEDETKDFKNLYGSKPELDTPEEQRIHMQKQLLASAPVPRGGQRIYKQRKLRVPGWLWKNKGNIFRELFGIQSKEEREATARIMYEIKHGHSAPQIADGTAHN